MESPPGHPLQRTNSESEYYKKAANALKRSSSILDGENIELREVNVRCGNSDFENSSSFTYPITEVKIEKDRDEQKEGEENRGGEGEGDGGREGSETKEREAMNNSVEQKDEPSPPLRPISKKKTKRMLAKEVLPLPLKAPHGITFVSNKNPMEGILRPCTDHFKFSIHLKNGHNQSPSMTWPAPMSFHLSLYHKKRSLWNESLCGECDGTTVEFCTVDIPKEVLEQYKGKVELHLST